MVRLKNAVDQFGRYVETTIESRFQQVARNDRLLDFIAAGLNYGSALVLETRKLEVELLSLRARTRLEIRKRIPTPPGRA